MSRKKLPAILIKLFECNQNRTFIHSIYNFSINEGFRILDPSILTLREKTLLRIFMVHGIHIRCWQIVLCAMGFVLFAASATWSGTVSTPSVSTLPVPTLLASVEKSSARVGDSVWLTLTYNLPKGAQLPEDPVVGGIEKLNIVEQVERTVERTGERTGEIKIRFLIDQLESFKTDRINFAYFDKNGNEQTIETDPVAITVLSNRVSNRVSSRVSNQSEKPEEATLKPIRDIIPLSPIWMPYLLWAAAVLGILLCIATGLIWWRRKHSAGKITATTVDLPHVLAEKEIDQLVARELFEKGDAKTFYFVFSEIMRRYMESIRHFPAAEMTTEEIMRHARTNTRDQQFFPVLGQADLVKFADAIPTPDRKTQDIKTARAYIRQTCPAPDKAPDKAPNEQSDLEVK